MVFGSFIAGTTGEEGGAPPGVYCGTKPSDRTIATALMPSVAIEWSIR